MRKLGAILMASTLLAGCSNYVDAVTDSEFSSSKPPEISNYRDGVRYVAALRQKFQQQLETMDLEENALQGGIIGGGITSLVGLINKHPRTALTGAAIGGGSFAYGQTLNRAGLRNVFINAQGALVCVLDAGNRGIEAESLRTSLTVKLRDLANGLTREINAFETHHNAFAVSEAPKAQIVAMNKMIATIRVDLQAWQISEKAIANRMVGAAERIRSESLRAVQGQQPTLAAFAASAAATIAALPAATAGAGTKPKIPTANELDPNPITLSKRELEKAIANSDTKNNDLESAKSALNRSNENAVAAAKRVQDSANQQNGNRDIALQGERDAQRALNEAKAAANAAKRAADQAEYAADQAASVLRAAESAGMAWNALKRLSDELANFHDASVARLVGSTPEILLPSFDICKIQIEDSTPDLVVTLMPASVKTTTTAATPATIEGTAVLTISGGRAPYIWSMDSDTSKYFSIKQLSSGGSSAVYEVKFSSVASAWPGPANGEFAKEVIFTSVHQRAEPRTFTLRATKPPS